MNKVEISVAFIAGILGIAYPILLEVVSRLDEKYSSLVVGELFRKEKARKFFRMSLAASLIGLLIYVADFPPPAKEYALGVDLEESAGWLVVIFTVILIISFYQFINTVLIFYTPTRFLRYLEKKHATNPSSNNYEFFRAGSDLLYSSVKQQNETIAKSVADFMSRAFMSIRGEQYPSEITYPRPYYDMIYKIIEDLANNKNRRFTFLEHLSASGTWFFGGSGDKISETTYGWLWNNALLAISYERDDYILYHWEHANQYKEIQLRYINQEFGGASGVEILNKGEIEKRDMERHRFMEHHYLLGTLLLSQRRYKCLKRAFSYTQSLPPKYALLPDTMDEVFHWYFEFSDPYNMKYPDLEYKYRFPETSGLHSAGIIRGYISHYIALLFLRQYTIVPYLYGMEPLRIPQLPVKQYEKKRWMDNLPYFRNSLNNILADQSLLQTLGYDGITDDWCRKNKKPTPTELLDQIIEKVNSSFVQTQETQAVSDSKYEKFIEASKAIVKPTLIHYESICNKHPLTGDVEKRYISGVYHIMDKSAFAEDQESDHGNYDTITAQSFINKFTSAISEIFVMARARTYTFELKDVGEAVKRLGINAADYSFVAFGLDKQEVLPGLSASGIINPNFVQFNMHNKHLGNSLFVIKTSELPAFIYNKIDEENQKKYDLKEILPEYNVYAAVADLHRMSELKKLLESSEKDKDLGKSVYVAIAIRLELQWKKMAQWIEIVVASPYRHQGVIHQLSDVQPIIEDDGKRSMPTDTAAQ